MKQIGPLTHGLDSDHSSESDGCLPAKHGKVEPVDAKGELHGIKPECASNNVSDGSSSLPSLLWSSSSSCKFVPLSALSSGTMSTDVELVNCKLQVLGDDGDSCSSFDDVNSAQLSHAMHEAKGDGTERSVNSVNNSLDQAASCDNKRSEPVEAVQNSEKLFVEHSLEPVSSCDEQRCEGTEALEQTLSSLNSDSEPVAHCSKDEPEPVSDGSKVKDKLARQIRYLEKLLSVWNYTMFLLGM